MPHPADSSTQAPPRQHDAFKQQWKLLQKHASQTQTLHLRELFDQDPDRFSKYCVRISPDLLADYSKNYLTDNTLPLLTDLARFAGLQQARNNMFSGARINTTENRAVLHTALRNQSDTAVFVNGHDVMPAIRKSREKMRTFARKIHTGTWTGWTGKALTDVVHIGIGGSSLGPQMVTRALTACTRGPQVHFISNVDPSHAAHILQNRNPETTLFLIASKSFTTQETMINAKRAKNWFLKEAQHTKHIARHFVALSGNTEAVTAFGIDPENMFPFADWVGGRYSVWSSIGLSCVLTAGMDAFEELLSGAFAMDEHFKTAALECNLPVILALLGVWYINFHGLLSHAVLPYEYYLEYFPAWLQQTDMESNGKSTTHSGHRTDYHTGPVLWGATGTCGQHAFFQHLHQGTQPVPCDFLVAANPVHPEPEQHRYLLSNCLGQTQTLMLGHSPQATDNTLRPHKILAGNRPSTTLLYRKLTPYTLGMLMALYEHKTFVQGVVWNINSFDQWGVEYGKQCADTICTQWENIHHSAMDSSTKGLLRAIKEMEK